MKRLVLFSFSSRHLAILALAAACSACQYMPQEAKVDLVQAPPQRPSAVAPTPPVTGGLFHPATFRPALEDRRAKLLGDIVTITIVENVTAAQKTSQALSHVGTTGNTLSPSSSNTTAGLPFMNPSTLAKLNTGGSSNSTFAGSGDNEANNTFTGSIAATVVEVLPNGHLVVVGEKQVGLNQNVDVLRFSGTIDPRDIQPGSIVSSTQVANARIQSRGRGAQDEALTVGWLSRFFFSAWPF